MPNWVKVTMVVLGGTVAATAVVGAAPAITVAVVVKALGAAAGAGLTGLGAWYAHPPGSASSRAITPPDGTRVPR